MLKRKSSPKQKSPKSAGIRQTPLKKGGGGKQWPGRGLGVKTPDMIGFINKSENNIGVQSLYFSILKRMARSIGNPDKKTDVKKKLTSISELNKEQARLLESLREDISSSGKNEF